MEFNELLRQAGVSKRELARRLGLSRNTPSNWGGKPPSYAIAYLKLIIENQGLSQYLADRGCYQGTGSPPGVEILQKG